MFSARLGFMRPDSVTEPDGPVLPPDIPDSSGNLLFNTNQGGNKTYADTRFADHPFINNVSGNWLINTFVMPKYPTEGFARCNGIDTTEFKRNEYNQTYPSGQPVHNKFTLGGFLNNTGGYGYNSNDTGCPMMLRDFFIHDGVLDLADTQKVEGWMCHSAGLQNILQTDHPYRQSPPPGFTPADLSPRAWYHAETNFDGTGTSTWSSYDGNFPLTKINTQSSNNLLSATEDGIPVINFATTYGSAGTGPVHSGCVYGNPAVANNNFTEIGTSIIYLFKPRQIPGYLDETHNKNIFIFSLQGATNSGYLISKFVPATQQTPLSVSDVSTVDVSDDSNVTTQSGNVSV